MTHSYRFAYTDRVVLIVGPYSCRTVSAQTPNTFHKKTVYFQFKDRILSSRTVYLTWEPTGYFCKNYRPAIIAHLNNFPGISATFRTLTQNRA